MFHAGQKVVCVNAMGAKNLVVGAIYTIKAVDGRPAYSPTLDEWQDFGLLLFEAEPNDGDRTFIPCRFRPIQERKTDIGFAHQILRRVSQGDRKLIEAE